MKLPKAILRGFYLALSMRLVGAAAGEGYVIEWGWDTALRVPIGPRLVCSNAVVVACGDGHGLALRGDGTVFGWGGNYFGNATGEPTTNAPYTASGLVKIRGQVLSNVVSVATRHNFSLAVTREGKVVAWGENYVPPGLGNVIAVAAGVYSSWALEADGTVRGWCSTPYSDVYGRLVSVDGLSNVVAIAYSWNWYSWVAQGIALRRDGTVEIWGDKQARLEPPAGLSNVVAVAAGSFHFLALKRDGTVVGWGWNEFGEATGVPTPRDPSLRPYSSGPVQVGGQPLSNIVAIAAGPHYGMALRADGTVVTWGWIGYKQYPVTVPAGLSNVVAIAAGRRSCLAITTNWAVARRFLN